MTRAGLSDEEREGLADSISGCFSNVSNLPEWMQVPTLGRDTRPLLLLAADAVLRSGWLTDLIRDAQSEALREAARALPGFDSIRTHGDAAAWLRSRASALSPAQPDTGRGA